ncbi:ABC transporter ATP-binding protein [Desulfosporosinus meridiei]|uniref:Oligopeptide/dipeptide ABC transporter, ATP-binding protein n=1 Tax=Desulfosporosinus meridiei (strain ATCC BAA-275 / DSM 13257 / KCTC 12902 / NCIMB 13706 / S10) TaxID=768704 RepID=J7J0X2_DESMD|nr:dipeptide ABC transporter ATP-binding protein [Desulfosporosinus meridiei]AFQ44958.1 oligopeptide/dipeptide ABC transporter, ATP-binding protein [Desulfosporosinus meridiei DSM 13257]
MEDNVLVQVQNLKMYFQSESSFSFNKKYIKAVDDVSFELFKGETFGLVGESGCGKSTLGRTILGLYKPNAGKVIFEGEDIVSLKNNRMKDMRKKMQLIFQDPSASLNPRKTIENILNEPFHIHNVGSKVERKAKIKELMNRVGLSEYHLSRYPHEMSGGQKQRVGIARALTLNPKLIICDEPVSALDVSIQAQVINLLEDLQKEYDLTYLFISHNLSVVHHICNRVGVMYLGKLVETGSHADIYHNTQHPYAKALISAIPNTDPDLQKERILLKGDVPSPANPPSGCRFHTRCPEVTELCSQAEPLLKEVFPGHFVACHGVE